MMLCELTIEGFRNLRQVALELSPGVTLFWGRNAQGKTNVLEAVHYVATGRSFRTRYDRECLPWDSEGPAVARIEARIERGGVAHHLAISLTERAKFAWLDGKALGRLGDLLGHLMVVVFTPDDIGLAAGSPVLRRRYMDMALAQVSPIYLAHLQSYVEALRQRNTALRTADSSLQADGTGGLDVWAERLVAHGVEISLARRSAIGELAMLARELYGQIAPSDGPLVLEYRSGSGIGGNDDRFAAAERFRARLLESAAIERARRQTGIGPHRDDFILRIGGKDVRYYGSQGQQRSAALALRLAEVKWMSHKTGESPLLLADDLGVELDSERRQRLLALFRTGVQTLATTAGDPEILGPLIGADRAIEVHAGRLHCGAEVEKQRTNRPMGREAGQKNI
ncbi:MAG: DNA replication/repair protein RecF [Candidatus Sumerlaeia bacterium]|nr:DNA replication/repair protein RecF [Candidatus Sumerlaeia bacterium]